MAIGNRRALKESALQTLQHPTGDPRRLILLFTGIHAVLVLVIALADMLLEQQISGTGGLGGLGTRSVLQTVQQILTLLNSILPTFWSMGYLYAMLKLSRQEKTTDADLLQGFRCFAPVLRLTVLQTLLFSLVSGLLIFVIVSLLSFSPLAMPVYQVMLPLVDTQTGNMDPSMLDEAAMAAVMDAATPLALVSTGLAVLLMLPLIYKFRLASYYLMDAPEYGAVAAMLRSTRAMKNRRLQLFALDVSFWWYYLVESLTLAVPYLSLLLPVLGIELPFSDAVAAVVFLAVTLALQLVLYILARNQVTMTYVKAYEVLDAESANPTPAQAEPPKKLPWDEPPMNNG